MTKWYNKLLGFSYQNFHKPWDYRERNILSHNNNDWIKNKTENCSLFIRFKNLPLNSNIHIGQIKEQTKKSKKHCPWRSSFKKELTIAQKLQLKTILFWYLEILILFWDDYFFVFFSQNYDEAAQKENTFIMTYLHFKPLKITDEVSN